MAWHGMAWHGMAWHGMAWHGMAWHGMAWHAMAWYGMVWYGMVGQVALLWFGVGTSSNQTQWREERSSARVLAIDPHHFENRQT